LFLPSRRPALHRYDSKALTFFFLIGCCILGTKNGEIKLFQLDDEKLLKTVALSSHPISLMTASKHGFLAVQVDGNRIVILSLVEERIVDNMLEPFDCGITDIAFSPLHPSLLAVAGDDGSITVVDIHSTSDCFVKIRFSSAHISPVSSIAFSPTNSCLLCSVGLDKRLCFFDVEKKKKRIRMFPLNDYCESLQFLNSGSHLIISFQRGQLSLFDLRGGIQERSAITTGQVIQSICILNDSMAAWAAQQRTERNSDNIGRQSESVAQEKENMAFNTMHHNNSRVVSPAKQDNEFDFVKLVQRNRNSSMLDDSPANSRSMAVVTSSGHRSESWSKQALSSCDERKHSQPLNNEIPTKENFSRTFSASWEETPISISKEQRNSENSLLLSSTLNRPVPCEDSNPFHCLLRTESPSLGAIPSPTTKKQIIAHDTNNNNVDPCNDNNNNNMYFSLLQSIEDIQYESTREMKQHIQNLHIDMLRNFEEQQVSI